MGQKLTRMFGINMILTIFYANVFAYLLIPDIQEESKLNVPLDLSNLINEYFFLFVTNSYLSSLFSIFDIVWGIRLVKRYIKKNNYLRYLMKK